jgi:hypothetical protein
MITNQFKAIVSTLLQSLGSNIYGKVPFKDTNNNTRYAGGMFSSQWPRIVTTGVVSSATSAGIVLGTGSTPASADDYRIETPITSGLSATVTYTRDLDSNGNPYLQFTINVTNTSSSDIIVRELAYNQTVSGTSSLNGTSSVNYVVCFDHTVLSNPVTIPAGGSAAILYTLKTIVS